MPRRVLHDRYFRQAQREGYLARSAYKLIEIQQRKRIIRPRDRVLDLGCAPGSWLQVASELVGPSGLVVGIDRKPVDQTIAPNVRTIVGDVHELDAETIARSLDEPRDRPFDVVLSDMAPNTTGAGDGLRSVRLCRRVLDLLPDLLRPRGNLTIKVLECETYPDLLARTKSMFREARGFKPRASRDVSREIYIVARGFKPLPDNASTTQR